MSKSLALALSVTLSAALIGSIPACAQQSEQSTGRSTSAGQTINDDPYQGPNGHYNNEADFTRDVNGTPCGINCANKKQERNNLNGQ